MDDELSNYGDGDLGEADLEIVEGHAAVQLREQTDDGANKKQTKKKHLEDNQAGSITQNRPAVELSDDELASLPRVKTCSISFGRRN